MAGNRFLSKIIRILAACLALSMAFSAIILFVVMPLAIKGDEIETPNLTGNSQSGAEQLLKNSNIRFQIDSNSARFSSEIPAGYILDQIPPPRAKMKRRKPIKLILSRGPERSVVPNLIGKPLREIESLMQASGLKRGELVKIHSDDFPISDTVIAQYPSAESDLKRGDKIDLLVSQGRYPTWLLMPKLKGLKLQEAEAVIKNSHLSRGEVETVYQPDLENGIVIHQTPDAGERVKIGQVVNYQVSISEQGRRTIDLRPVVFSYRIPAVGSKPRKVKIFLYDDRGNQELIDRMYNPGAQISLPLQILGKGVVKVFLDDSDQPVEEKNL